MTIRFATKEDEIRIIRAIQNKHMDYNQPTHVREDIRSNRLIVAEDKGKLLGSCALVYESNFGYHAIKRLCVFRQDFKGQGRCDSYGQVALRLFQYVKDRCDSVDYQPHNVSYF